MMLALSGDGDKGDFSFRFLKVEKLHGESALLLRDCKNIKDCKQL